jgi:hypothetical protein
MKYPATVHDICAIFLCVLTIVGVPECAFGDDLHAPRQGGGRNNNQALFQQPAIPLLDFLSFLDASDEHYRRSPKALANVLATLTDPTKYTDEAHSSVSYFDTLSAGGGNTPHYKSAKPVFKGVPFLEVRDKKQVLSGVTSMKPMGRYVQQGTNIPHSESRVVIEASSLTQTTPLYIQFYIYNKSSCSDEFTMSLAYKLDTCFSIGTFNPLTGAAVKLIYADPHLIAVKYSDVNCQQEYMQAMLPYSTDTCYTVGASPAGRLSAKASIVEKPVFPNGGLYST